MHEVDEWTFSEKKSGLSLAKKLKVEVILDFRLRAWYVRYSGT